MFGYNVGAAPVLKGVSFHVPGGCVNREKGRSVKHHVRTSRSCLYQSLTRAYRPPVSRRKDARGRRGHGQREIDDPEAPLEVLRRDRRVRVGGWSGRAERDLGFSEAGHCSGASGETCQ